MTRRERSKTSVRTEHSAETCRKLSVLCRCRIADFSMYGNPVSAQISDRHLERGPPFTRESWVQWNPGSHLRPWKAETGLRWEREPDEVRCVVAF